MRASDLSGQLNFQKICMQIHSNNFIIICKCLKKCTSSTYFLLCITIYDDGDDDDDDDDDDPGISGYHLKSVSKPLTPDQCAEKNM